MQPEDCPEMLVIFSKAFLPCLDLFRWFEDDSASFKSFDLFIIIPDHLFLSCPAFRLITEALVMCECNDTKQM